MADTAELSEAEKIFLRPYLPPASREESSARSHASQGPEQSSGEAVLMERVSPTNARPFVTLTYACSLDSMIALAQGVRTTLSGPETKSMTHYLRLHHDAILVGVGTAIADDPALNCRYPGAVLQTQPQPVTVDTSLRWDVGKAKVSQLATEGKGKSPWVIHSAKESHSGDSSMVDCRRLSVDEDGLSIPFESGNTRLPRESRRLSWKGILKALKQSDIESVMIEGGATVINELLSHPELVDTVIITVAPTFLGQGGTAVSPEPRSEQGNRVNAAQIDDTAWRQFGNDVVLCGRLRQQ